MAFRKSLLSKNMAFILNSSGLLIYIVFINCMILTFPDVVDRGVYCRDPTIIYPEKKELISGLNLILISILPVVLIVMIVNYFVAALTKLPSPKDSYKTRNLFKFCDAVKVCWMENVLFFLIFTAGVTSCYLIIEIAKLCVGEYRPRFLAVCKPNGQEFVNWDQLNCVADSLMTLDSFKCAGDASDVEDAMKSFPSGHASIAIFAGVFGVAYLQKFLRQFVSICMIKTLIQVCFLGVAWFVAFTRIADNHHHLLDVITGGTVGGILAIIFVEFCFPTQHFRRPEVKEYSTSRASEGVNNPARKVSNDNNRSMNFDVETGLDSPDNAQSTLADSLNRDPYDSFPSNEARKSSSPTAKRRTTELQF